MRRWATAATAELVVLGHDPEANTFSRRPPSLPGICPRCAVFCRSRQEVRESSSSRRVEAADPAAGLSAELMIGIRPDVSAVADLWDCVRYTPTTNRASSWTPARTCSTAMGAGRGGDVIRFAELYHQVRFPQALWLLRQWRGSAPLLQAVADLYRMQLHRHGEAVAYLNQRGIHSPELIEEMRIGYAPGGCLRRWLTQLGYPLQSQRDAGLVTGAGYDAYTHRIVFPLEGNLYGRSLSAGSAAASVFAGRQRWLVRLGPGPAASGSDSRRGSIRLCRRCGRPDFTTSPARWVPTSMHASFANSAMVREPSIWPLMPTRTAAVRERHNHSPDRLTEHGVSAHTVSLPEGHDPNSFFAQGGDDAHQFRSLLEAAR